MKIKITSILMLSLAASLFLAPLSYAQNAADIAENNVYESELGFSVLFPPGWEDYLITSQTVNWGELGTASAVDIGLPSAADMITVSRHPIDQWNRRGELDGATPAMLGMTDNFVLAYSINQETLTDEGEWVIDHITVHSKTLSDLEGALNEEAIQYLLDTGVVSGYPDGTFKPGQTINRAELMKIITEARTDVPDGELYQECFPDVTNEWFAKYVCYAKEQNWVQGYPDGNFRPEQTINKVEALKMIINSQDISIPGAVNDGTFEDVDNSAWYAPFVKAAADKGLLEQTEGVYGVAEFITRGEVSENIYRALLLSTIESFGSEPVMEEEPGTETPEDIVATVEGYAVFKSNSYNFSIEYPDQWYYEGVGIDPFSSNQTYEFGPGLIDDEPALIKLEISGGSPPEGTIIEMNDKTLILLEEGEAINVYYVGALSERLFRVFGSSEYEEIIVDMASTIEDLPEEQQGGY